MIFFNIQKLSNQWDNNKRSNIYIKREKRIIKIFEEYQPKYFPN